MYRKIHGKLDCEVSGDSIWDLGERTVLVVAEPGMGNSRTTTQVAWNTKLADPKSWVVRINLNDHTWKLQEIHAAKFNLDTLVQFLCSTAFPKSEYRHKQPSAQTGSKEEWKCKSIMTVN